MFYKKEYQKVVAERNAWRNCCVARDDEIKKLNRTIRQLKGVCDFLERDNAKLRAKENAKPREKEVSTFDKMNYQKLKKANAELNERLKRAEMKLSAKDSTEKSFKDNCCFGLAFLGETVRELNKQDEEQKRREGFLLHAVEGLMNEGAEFSAHGRSFWIDLSNPNKEEVQPEIRKKAKDKENDK